MRLNCATPGVFNVSHILLMYFFYILGRLNFLSAMCLQLFHMKHFVKKWHILEEGDNLTTSVYWGRFLWWRGHTHEMLFEVTISIWRPGLEVLFNGDNLTTPVCRRFHMNHFVKIWHRLEEGDNLTTSVYWGRFYDEEVIRMKCFLK